MRHCLAFLMIAFAALSSTPADAEIFPDRPIHIVVPFPAGGSNDVVARFLGQKLSELFGQSVIIDNRAGAGGNVGAEFVARSIPDGHTLLLTAPPPLAVNRKEPDRHAEQRRGGRLRRAAGPGRRGHPAT